MNFTRGQTQAGESTAFLLLPNNKLAREKHTVTSQENKPKETGSKGAARRPHVRGEQPAAPHVSEGSSPPVSEGERPDRPRVREQPDAPVSGEQPAAPMSEGEQSAALPCQGSEPQCQRRTEEGSPLN